MNKYFLFGRSSVSALWYFLLVVVLPLTTLVLAGLVYLWQQNLLLITVAAWLIVSGIAYIALVYWPDHKAKNALRNTENGLPDINSEQEIKDLPDRLKAQSYWSVQDRDIWDRSCLSIETTLQQKPDWQAMPDLALEQLALIAAQYHQDSKHARYRFTVPELLLVVSVTSSRYRQLVIEYVPYIDKFSIASANTLFDQKTNISTGYLWFNRVRRTLRLINPASAVVGELRDLLTDKIFSQASGALQNDLKRLLLQEVTQVAIDLYSGKLTASDAELNSFQSDVAREDKLRTAVAPEPIRVLLLGQTSAGKSSLVNALTDTLQAEVGLLPVTDRLTVHELSIAGESVVNLVDTPGIDGSTQMQDQLVKAVLEADLIIWLAKSTQPARAPDQELNELINAHYRLHPSKLQPPIILVLTHIDQLKPKAEWEPPYDLASEQAKAVSVSTAIKSIQSSIGLPENTLVVPVYTGDSYEHYNVDALAAQIMLLMDKSTNVQFNRRRIERGLTSKDWRSHWTQAKKLGRVIGQSIVKGN